MKLYEDTQAGFLLIEVMYALLIVSITAVSIAAYHGIIAYHERDAYQRMHVVNVVRNFIELHRAQPKEIISGSTLIDGIQLSWHTQAIPMPDSGYVSLTNKYCIMHITASEIGNGGAEQYAVVTVLGS